VLLLVTGTLLQVLESLAGEANGVNTLNQFGTVKFDELVWMPDTPSGKKGFVRLAIKKYKAVHGVCLAWAGAAVCSTALLFWQVMLRKKPEQLQKQLTGQLRHSKSSFSLLACAMDPVPWQALEHDG